MIISINGRIVSPDKARISVLDQAVLSGYGVFETLLAVNGQPVWLTEHLARLERSRRALNIPQRFKQRRIADFVRLATGRFQRQYARVRITLTAGAGGLWNSHDCPAILIIIVNDHQIPPSESVFVGELVETGLADNWLARHKTTSWLPHLVLSPDCRPRIGKKESNQTLQILNSPTLGITEFSHAALILRRRNNILTAPEEIVFPSLTRQKILRQLQREPRWKIKCRRLKVADLLGADEIIGANSLRLAFALKELRIGTRRKKYAEPTLAPMLYQTLLASVSRQR